MTIFSSHSPEIAADSGTRWHAASLQPGKAAFAEEHLRRQGFRSFTPLREQQVRSGRKHVLKTVPFFPGYMFVAFDPERTRWRAVNGTLGIRSLIMQGDRPLPVPVGLVESLITLTGEDGLLDISGGIVAGGRVRLLSGPFTNLIGTLDRIESSGRCRVLIDIMNGQVPVILENRALVAA